MRPTDIRPNGAADGAHEETPQAWGRVTSMARWLARRRQQPAGALPRISVVIPVYNGEATLAECLTRLCNSTAGNFEIVLVDDGSTDQSRAIASNFPVRIVPTAGRVGPAAARNLGARVAEGDVVFFIDSDVMVRPDTVARVVETLCRAEVDGVVGVQAVDMRHRDLVSQYKNIWMRWTYVRLTGDVPLFYTTAAAIRREAFLRAGGFDQGYGNPNVEDTAFGQKLARLGIRVRVEPAVEVEHVKRYSLAGLLRTDYLRAVSLARLKLRQRAELAQNNTSVPNGYVASIPLVGLGTLLLLLAAALGSRPLGIAGLIALGLVAALNRGFVGAIAESEGRLRAVLAVPLLWLELLVAGIGGAVGILTYVLGKRY